MLLQALCIISYQLVNSNLSYSPETPNLGQNQLFLEPCDIQTQRMTLKNKKAPLLWHIKLCGSLVNSSVNSNLSYSPYTLNPVKIDDFFSRVT